MDIAPDTAPAGGSTPAIAPDHQHRYAITIRSLDKLIDSLDYQIRCLGAEKGIDKEKTYHKLLDARVGVFECRNELLIVDYEAIRRDDKR